ncbi:MAG: thiol:disulfide interchange protein DsbA/DsbL [Betaproteobacteria bacterium]|nr:thiol:disulfide interchange protein DsbA/DsbL [Betaproteobacteria bacterium]
MLHSLLRPLITLSLTICAALSLTAHAAQPGKDYIEIKPARATATPGKVEVLEFFWYGCPHCYQLEPDLLLWSKKLPRNVVLVRQPAVLGESWMTLTQAYYALESLGEIPRLHGHLFNALHNEGRRFNSPESVVTWAATQGVNPDKLKAAFQSFTVHTKANRAKQISQEYRLEGVPALVINGKYLTSPSMAGGYAGALRVADELIAQELKKLGK